jgi:hypothetical protein
VNFVDKPACCIAITTTRETARLFGSGKDDAAWSLTEKKITYLDNATTGLYTLEELWMLSREMDEIAACGGFTFKETMISGDPMADPAYPKKVLGLIWGMAVDQLQMDIKVNFSSRRRGPGLTQTQTFRSRWTPSRQTRSQNGCCGERYRDSMTHLGFYQLTP